MSEISGTHGGAQPEDKEGATDDKMTGQQVLPGETRMVFPVFPRDTNHYHTLFGGMAMAWMDQAAFICATRWARRPVVTVHSSAVDFRRPIPEGTIVEVVARIASTGRSSMRIAVSLYSEPMDRQGRQLACSGEFVLVALDEAQRPVAVPAYPGETVK
jgi:acyl-CoA hydrolase